MPSYDMTCDSCGHAEELAQSIKLDLPSECPSCGGGGYRQDYSSPRMSDRPPVVKGELKTVGQVWEDNARRMGAERVEREARELAGNRARARENAPWWREGTDRPIDLSKIADAKKYIETGETS